MQSEGGIGYSNGSASLSQTDVTSPSGGGIGNTRGYCNRSLCDYDGPNGWNWWMEELPYAVATASSAAVVSDPNNPYWFDLSGGTYTPRYNVLDVNLVDNGTSLTFTKTSNARVVTTVFNSLAAPTNPGMFVSHTDARGVTTTVSSATASQINGLQRSYSIAGVTTTEYINYAYYPGSGSSSSSSSSSGPSAGGAGKIKSVTYSKQVGSGPIVPITQATSAYYGASSVNGSYNDLATVTQQVPDGSGGWLNVGIDYYRYYLAGAANGFAHGLKAHFGPEAVRLMFNAGIDYLTAPDATIQPYADHAYQYDSSRRVTWSTSAVCPSCTGGGTTHDAFAYTASAFPNAFGNWATKTVQTLPDSSQVVVYTNYVGLPVLRAIIDPTGTQLWGTFYRWDASGRRIWTAHPSAVALPASLATLEAFPDLLNFNSGTGLYQYLNSSTGLIDVTDYYTSTSGGGVAGYVQDRQVQQGQSGTPIMLKAFTYTSNTDSSGNTIYPTASVNVYPIAGNTSTFYTTAYAYTFYAGTNQMSQKATTWPVVSAAQNGSGTPDTSVERFDIYQNRTGTIDERGIVGQYTFDVVMSRLTGQVLNVQSGVTAPGVNVASRFTFDNQGRGTGSTGPLHTAIVNGAAASVQTVTWTVYNQTPRPASGTWAPDSTWTATGYAILTTSGYDYTLVDPVTIANTDKDGRSTDTITSHRTTGSGALSPTDTFAQTDWQNWSSTQYNEQHQTISSRVYFLIPASGSGVSGANYAETDFGYDILERQNRVASPFGTSAAPTQTITRKVWTTPQRVASVWIGTNDTGATDSDPTGGGAPGNNMVMVSSNQWDGGSAGGDGNLTEVTEYVSATPGDTRVTSMSYGFRDRKLTLTDPLGRFTLWGLDNLGRQTLTQQFASLTGNLIAQSGAGFDARGRQYQTLAYAVDPASGTVGNVVTGNTWFDPSGNAVQQIAPGAGVVFTKNKYNGVNWVTATYAGYNTSGTSYARAQTAANDVIMEQTQFAFDEAGNSIAQTSSERLNDATGVGPLCPCDQPAARVSTSATWFDGINRSVATANFGTGSRSELPVTPTGAAITTATSYDAAGRAYQSTDAKGIVGQTGYDNANRVTQTIEDLGGLNRTTNFTFTLDGQQSTMTAVNPVTGNQTTTWTFGTTLPESGVARNDLVRYIDYPDSVSGSDREAFTYNRLGEKLTSTDQRGNVRAFYRDVLGRQTNDCVTTLGGATDGSVLQIATAYEIRGMISTVTSYNSATPNSGTILNQVQLTYNSFAQLTLEQQEHSGAVTGSTLAVGYAYDSGASGSNEIRFNQLTYPNGRNITYSFGTVGGMNDLLNRVDTIQDTTSGTVNLASYVYLGLGTVVRIIYPEPQVWLDLWGGVSGQFSGLDQFNRVIDQRWQNNINTTPTDIDRYQYAYDPNSNPAYKASIVGTPNVLGGLDELYGTDSLNRLIQMQRGVLNATRNAITSTPARQMNWTLDATGNWPDYVTQAAGTTDLHQARTSSPVNEITNITASGRTPVWVTPAYDAAGNMTTMPQPAMPTSAFAAVYDAWKRMAAISAGGSPVGQYRYDGRHRRIISDTTGSRHFYFTDDWQDIEQRVGTATTMDQQHVWGMRYIDELVCRDDAVPRRLYACQDATFNLTTICSTTGSVQERFVYDPYGTFTTLNGSWSVTTEMFGWAYFRQGGYFDTATGLYLFRHRLYNHLLGVWAQRDVAGYIDGASLYEYLKTNPATARDPDGLASITLPYGCATSFKVPICFLFITFWFKVTVGCSGSCLAAHPSVPAGILTVSLTGAMTLCCPTSCVGSLVGGVWVGVVQPVAMTGCVEALLVVKHPGIVVLCK